MTLLKHDEANEEHLLNGAIFSIRDITGQNIDSSDKNTEKLSWDDLPEQFEVNDEFSIHYHEGNTQTFHIQAIEYYDLICGAL